MNGTAINDNVGTDLLAKMNGTTINDNVGTDLLGKGCLVTGGGSGIGKAVCELLASQGAQVIVTDISKPRAEATLKYLISKREHLAIQMDVTDESSVNAAFEAATKHLGKAPEIIVNSAGISGPFKTLSEISKEEIEAVFSVNLLGTVLVMQAAARALQEEGRHGSIINIGSVGSKLCIPTRGHYAASKAAVSAYTRTAAKELGRYGIRCNTVLPGMVATPMVEATMSEEKMNKICAERTAIGRVGTPQEIGNVVAFLASDRSSYVTGSEYEVSGCWFIC